MKTIPILLLVLLAGCGTPQGVIKAMSKDTATSSVTINTIYGTVRYIRIVPKEGSIITLSVDGSASVRQNVDEAHGKTMVITPDGKITTINP